MPYGCEGATGTKRSGGLRLNFREIADSVLESVISVPTRRLSEGAYHLQKKSNESIIDVFEEVKRNSLRNLRSSRIPRLKTVDMAYRQFTTIKTNYYCRLQNI